MEFGQDYKEYRAQMSMYEENKYKAYSKIFGYCNKTMQNRIEELTEFDADIRDNPFVLLEKIKLKMYGQVRSKYEFFQPTNTILQFLSLKQEHNKALVDYVKRFKQSVDNFKAIFGKSILDDYITKTDDYKNGDSDD